MLRNGGREGLSKDPQSVHTGCNSGFQSLNLAVLAGARRLVLLGYDAKPAADGKMHWFGEHPVPTPKGVFEEMVKYFRTAVAPLKEAGVEVLNATPGSAVNAFPRVSLESVLHDPA